jgi:predicted AAA+ superfamily ATPase
MPDQTYLVIITKVAEVFTVASDPEEARVQAERYAKRQAVAKRTTHGQVLVTASAASPVGAGPVVMPVS